MSYRDRQRLADIAERNLFQPTGTRLRLAAPGITGVDLGGAD